MADLLQGMFQSPDDIRASRIDEMMKNRRAISNSGGSWDALLGQVAAGGGAMGEMLAEGAGGMFGLKTPEEAKAAQVQDLLSQIDITDPVGVRYAAKLLNNQGLTGEAIKLMELHTARLNDKLTQERIRASEEGTGQIVSVQTGNKTTGEPIYTYYKYNGTTGEMEKVGEGYKPFTPKSDIFGGLGGFGGVGADGLPIVVMPDKGATAAGSGKSKLDAWRKSTAPLVESTTDSPIAP